MESFQLLWLGPARCSLPRGTVLKTVTFLVSSLAIHFISSASVWDFGATENLQGSAALQLSRSRACVFLSSLVRKSGHRRGQQLPHGRHPQERASGESGPLESGKNGTAAGMLRGVVASDPRTQPLHSEVPAKWAHSLEPISSLIPFGDSQPGIPVEVQGEELEWKRTGWTMMSGNFNIRWYRIKGNLFSKPLGLCKVRRTSSKVSVWILSRWAPEKGTSRNDSEKQEEVTQERGEMWGVFSETLIYSHLAWALLDLPTKCSYFLRILYFFC